MAKTPVWLNDSEQATWRAFLAANAGLENGLERQLQRAAGIPHAYYMIMALVSEAPEHRLRMQDLANSAQSSQSRLSHAVSRLEGLGWVNREKATNDKRGKFVHLTEAGWVKLKELAPGHVGEVRRRMFDPLTPEQVEQFRAICQAIADAGTAPENYTSGN